MRRVPNKLLGAPLTGLMAEVEASAHKPEWILGLQETVLEEGSAGPTCAVTGGGPLHPRYYEAESTRCVWRQK